ncbi:glycosyltransferase [Rhodococcus antarcticus]|uniref:Glycosyltransferase n=1 Tax=Rhodococcus antarcticus TaxID=2987751 RepID=A0ABY6NYT7_9NOCA|nr:glycosyltransferase [Rhodococcus antarcticus]UZJ24554.1 glycosyltransferase [Rhodococcus antarcticus]
MTATTSTMVAQRGLFGGPSPLVSDDMYCLVERGIAHRSRTRVQLEPDARVSTNTYFGRLPASYWQRWTAVTEVTVSATVAGRGRVAVVASDVEGETRTVSSAAVDGDGTLRLAASIDHFVDGGALWVEVTSTTERLVLEDLTWSVDAPAEHRPASVVICTFNRADDCVATLAAMAEDGTALAGVETVYVVDQGTDRVESREGFARVSALLGDKLRYITQPNLGGAGGFTRGLFEVTDQTGSEHANVIFMDDDVLCEPETVLRLNAFANKTVEPAIIGGQMLYLLHPEQLHVGAERADLPTLAAGIATPRALHDIDVTENHQDERVDGAYNGWWTCLIPAEIVQKIGFPLPLFFQWDDIEYGYRARAAGHATVTLPGAGVWHADFAWKDWDDWHRYFNIRNAMVTAALHSDFNGKQVAKGLRAQLTRYLLSMQYGLAATMIRAVEDFLEGPELLHDGGQAAAGAIRKERAGYPETVRHPASAVPGLRAADMSIVVAPPAPSLKRVILVKRILDQALGRTQATTVAIPAAEAHWWHVSKFDQAVVTDASQEGVRLRRRDPGVAKELLVRGIKVCRRLSVEAPQLQARYQAAMPQLTSRENWARLYGRS